jgi:2'-5' RNA ligase
MIRLFAAIPVPPAICEALALRQRGLAEARWRPIEALHLTLRFFGDVSEDRADDLDLELSQVRGAPMDIELEGVGAFGEGADIHTVWAGVKANPALEQLARRCEIAARRAGLKPDTRAFRAHVTLAYLRRPDPGPIASWIQSNNLLREGPFRCEAFGLYSSWRTEAGSSYRLERQYRLAADRL